MNKEISFKIYTDRGIKRIAISYRINNRIKGYNVPLSVWHKIINSY